MIVPGSAAAGNARQPIFGDLNRDGRIDRVTLGPDTGSPTGTPTCEVSVEYGKRDGGFRAPQTFTFTSPWPRQPFCPNMGEAINLGKRGQIELVLTHFVVNTEPELLVLRDFKLVATFNGMIFPSTIRSADFNGDGRTDLWESSDQTQRLQTLTNTPEGTLVPGPIDVCSQDSIPSHVLADFNGDGGQDFLVAVRCHTLDQSVRVLFGDGQPPVTLVGRLSLHRAFEVFPVDVNNDGIPDAGVKDTADDGTVTYRLFQNDGHDTFIEVTALL